MKIAFNPSTVAALTSPPNNKDITFDLKGHNIFARGVEFKGTDTNTWRPVVDNLTSDSTTSSLSAKQGKVLKALIDGKSNSGHTHDDRYLKLTGGTLTGNLTGTSATFSGRFYGNGDDEGIIIKPASNGYAGLTLGAHDGERSVFYFTKGKPFWRYNNGTNNLDIYHPKKAGTIALTSDIPNKGSWNYDDRYLRLSGGTMTSDALITFADSGSWGTDKGPQGARGGLYWSGQSDYAKLYAEETAGDNLDLVIQFGDDNSNGLSIRNKSNIQTSYISASGIITTSTFKGNLDWSYITNKPSSYTPSAHTHAWNSLTHSSTTANQAILTNGSANGWKLYTLNISAWDNAANKAHSHANKSVLDGITSTHVSNWNTAYTFVHTITGTDTDKIINKWDEIVNFLSGIDSSNKLNTLLNSKLSVYELADKTNVGTIKNNGIYYSTTDASSGTLTNSPFNTGFALINMTSYDGGDDLRRSRLAFNAYGEIKVSDDRSQLNTAETWYNVLTSKNSGISGSTIKLNGTSITVYSSGTADGRYVKKSGDTMTGALNFANGTWNLVGDDSYMGGCNVSGHFGIRAANTTYPGVAFFNKANAHLGSLTAYSGNIKYGAYSLQFLDNGNTSVGASTSTNPFSAYDKNAVKDGQAICVWGQSSYLSNLASDSGDMSLWLKRINAKAATLNMVLDGEYYANGTQRLAHVSEIPSSLKNPYALTISLNGTSQGPYDGSAAKSINITPGSIGAATSGHNHDGRYVYNYGRTQMDGASKNKNALGMSTTSGISEDWWHILQAAWNDEYRWNSQIAFPTQNRNGMYYRSGLNDNTKWGAWVKLLDTGNSYVTNGKGVINGTTITQVENATNATNSTNARKLVNWYSARPTSLNALFGDGSLRIFYATSSTTEGKSPNDATVLHLAWDNNGGWDSQLAINSPSGRVYTRSQDRGTWQPWKTLAFTTDIPSSLKNPYSFNVFGVTYDGSAARTVTTSTFISQVNEATSTVTDGTMLITSYASNSGFADTNAVNVPYKRKAVHLWEYIRAKTDSLYATKDHNHDNKYLRWLGNANQSNMNAIGRISHSSGMTNLSDPGNTTDNPMEGGTKSGLWHLYWQTNYTDDPSGSNAWVAQIVNRAGTDRWWVRSRDGGKITNGTGWASNWRFLVTAPTSGLGNGNQPVYINSAGEVVAANSYPTSLRSPHSLTLKANGTTLAIYDGSSAKEANFTYANVGAASASHTHSYYAVNENYGGFKKAERLPTSGFYQSSESESGGNAPWTGWMHLINCQHSNTTNNYALQIAASFGNNNIFRIRVTNNNVNNAWRDIIHSGNIGSQSVNYANSAGNSDKVDGFHAASSNKPWGTIPVITTRGWMDIGKHLEFHFDNTTGSDYSTILRCTGNYSNIVNLPSVAGTLALISDIPSSVKNPNAIKFKDINGNVVTYDGSAAKDLTSGTYIAKLPYGFASFTSGATWGNTTGTSFASWNDSTGGSIDFRRDNPSSGKMSIKVDGRVYVNEGHNPVLSAESNNGFWGMRTPDGGNDWIRTPNNGLIPYVSGGAGGGHSSLGTNSWYFSTAYIDKVYGSLKGNADTASSASKLTTARNIALGTDLRGSANFDGSGNITINANINACSVSVGSTNGLPFKRIAHFETGNSWNDNALLLYISQGYINGSNGICRVEFRTDNISTSNSNPSASALVRWLVRNGYGLDSLYAGYYVTTGKAYIDIYLKTTSGYQGTVIRVLQDSRGGINSNVQLINSHYHSDTDHKEAYSSIEAASTALYNRAYTRIISGSDVGAVSYSNRTGSVHWNNVTNKPSSFTPSSHTHTWASITDKIVAGNEFNIVNAGFNSELWFNYKPINDASKTATISQYIMGNGAKGIASIKAAGFIKNGSNSSYVLLGDGGHKTISSLSVNYANSAGSATKVIVNQHTTNDINYPLVWSNQSNTSNVTENQLYKSWSDLYYNPKNKRLTVGGSVVSSLFVKSGGTSQQLLRADGGVAAFNWSGQSGQPTWLWGGNDFNSYYVYNPSNFRVAYAASAGNADTLDGEHANSFVRAGAIEAGDGDLNTLDTYSFIKSVNSKVASHSPKGNNGWYNIIQAVHRNGQADGASYIGQIALGMTVNTGDMFFRGKRTDSWKTVIHSGNIGSQTVASASKLVTARKIWGQSFNGTADVNGTIYINNGDSENGAIILNNNVNTHARISAIKDNVVFNTGGAIRFGDLDWDYSKWAGLKYNYLTKTIYLGIADGSIFTTYGNVQNEGILNLRANISHIDLNSGTSIRGLSTDGSPYYSSITLKDTSMSLSAYGDMTMSTGPGTMQLSAGNAFRATANDIRLTCKGGYMTCSQTGSSEYTWIFNNNIKTTGQIIREGSSQTWVNGRNGALLRETSANGYHTLWSLKTTNGSWDFGEFNTSGWNNIPVLSYILDSNFNKGSNTTTYQIKFPLASGTVALTSNILNPTNYYWANVKVSASSSTTTSPTVHTLTATNALNVGSTLSINGSVIDCSADFISIKSKKSGSLIANNREAIRYDSSVVNINNVAHFLQGLCLSTNIYRVQSNGLIDTPLITTDGVTVLITTIIQSTSFYFRHANDGQLLFLKVGKKFSNVYFWCSAEDCEVVKANNFDVHLGKNVTKDYFADGLARIFIYKAIEKRWYEFYCG